MVQYKEHLDDVIQKFKEKNLKLTPQRIQIYSYLRSVCCHPSADLIYKNIKTSIPTISLATIYKNLNTLVKHGLINEINLCEENFRYDANIVSHGHIKCTSCNSVSDIAIKNNIQSILDSSISYKIDNFDLLLYGTCSDCSKKCL